MARKPRCFVSGMPYHIVNRGHNRMPCFGCEADKAMFFSILCNKLQEFSVKLHAFVLMSNHYHLLVTPEDGSEVPHFMQCLGRKFAGYFNTTKARSGTVWDGKYFASVIESDYYLLACYRYIELNPVRAGLVSSPGGYHWSSFHSNACGMKSNIIEPHRTYQALGDTIFNRLKAYRELFTQPISEQELTAIRSALSKNRVSPIVSKLVGPVPETCG